MADLKTELERIRQQTGTLTAKAVVEAAKSPKHPLHDKFEWDDKIAGRRYRLVQARELIKSVKIKFVDQETSEEVSTPRYLSIPSGRGFSYVPLEEIAEDPVVTEIVLREAERQWRTFFRRYGHIDKIIKVIISDIDGLEDS